MLDEKYPHEKVHLFLNKEAFVAGETVWFKAYLFTGNVQSYISKTLYVELLNETKQPVTQTLVALVSAVGDGSIDIPKNLPEGTYYLRAYTKWMLNFDEAFQYIYPLPVYNPSSPQQLSSKPVAWTAAVHPESGTLLADRENKLVVRLTAKGSLPDKWEGYVTEEETPAKKLLQFSSFNAQLASFHFTPAVGKRYLVHAADGAGNKTAIKFAAVTKGVALRTKQEGDQLRVEMIFQGIPNGGSGYKLVAATYGQMFYSAAIKKADAVVTTLIPVRNLLSGVVHLTLFDAAETPVAERLVFLQTGPEATVTVSTPTISNTPRGLNEWEVAGDTSMRDAYAISITDAALTSPRTRSLKSDLWLGDLSTDIHHPQWYFAADTVRTEALDALLVSEKWNRYNWRTVLRDSFPAIRYQPENYLQFKGIASHNGKRLKDEKLNLIFKFRNAPLQFSAVTTNAAGEFFLPDVAFYDSVTLYNQPTGKQAVSDVEFVIERGNQFHPYTGSLPPVPMTLMQRTGTDQLPMFVRSTMNMLAAQENENVLKEIKVSTKVKTPKEQLNERLSSSLFNTGEQVVFDFVNEEQNVTSYTHIFDWLEGRVAGLGFTILNEERTNRVTGTVIPAGQRIPVMRDEEPTIFIDEVVTDVTLVHNLSVSDIAMVKVIRGYFLGATSGGGNGGAIAIYTKRAGLATNRRSNAPTGLLVGYNPLPSFKEVSYSNDQQTSPGKDTRQQLHWATRLFKAAEAMAKVRFYNNDAPSGVQVVITGFTRDAQPVYLEKVVSNSQ